jgi:4-hydroxy-tetrahydrodipicolinate synthase
MRYQGVFTALIAPMRDGEIDRESLHGLVDAQLAGGVHGLVVNGTTGEAATLSDDEQALLVELVQERVEGRVPIIAGVGTNNTAVTIQRAERMARQGVDGLLVVTPYYNKPSQRGLAAHFRAVAGAVSPSTSVCLYNVPSRTSVSLAPETIEALAVLPNVDAIKEATTDMLRASEVIAAVGDNAVVLAGDDAAFLPMLALGAKGIVSAASNVVPEPFVQLFKTYRWGDIDDARDVHARYLAPIMSMYAVVNPVGVKAAAKLKGLIASDEVRLPLVGVTDEERETLRRALTAGGLLG